MFPTNQATSNQKECELIIQTLLHYPEYVQKGNELASLIKEFEVNNMALKEQEYWQIKGKTYRVIKEVFGINFMLLTTGKNGKLESLWLSELLPLTAVDFVQVTTKNQKKHPYKKLLKNDKKIVPITSG